VAVFRIQQSQLAAKREASAVKTSVAAPMLRKAAVTENGDNWETF